MKLIYVVQIIAAVWTLWDARKRRARHWLLWTLGSLLAPIVFVPAYSARRPLARGETREGGFACNFCRRFRLIWSYWMAAIVAHSLYKFSEGSSLLIEHGVEEALVYDAGVKLVFLFFMVWLVPFVGALVAGYLLKKPEVVETGPTGNLASDGVSEAA